MYNGNVTRLSSKVLFKPQNKMAVNISMSNRPVIEKIEVNACCCHFRFNCALPIVCTRFLSMAMVFSQLCGSSRPKLWVQLHYRDLTALIMRLWHLREILAPQEKAGSYSILLATAQSATSSGYNSFIFLSFTKEVSLSLHWKHSS